MFVSNDIVFLELHKTAGTHIGRLLNDILPGEQIGKHNRIAKYLNNKFILGSVRNPWDWYVSLWAYGCSQQGSVYHCVTQKSNWSYYHRQLPKEMGKNWLTPDKYLKQLFYDLIKPVTSWRAFYANSDDPELFRQWLAFLLNPKHRFDIREGYGFSPLSKHFGLMTYRYMKLFSSLENELYTAKAEVMTHEELTELWNKYKCVNRVVRTEQLESDLIEALEAASLKLTDQEKQRIISSKRNKTNSSKHQPSSYYYDDDSIALVAEKESLIIKQHNYLPPK